MATGEFFPEDWKAGPGKAYRVERPCPLGAPSCLGIPEGLGCGCEERVAPKTGTDIRREIIAQVEGCVCRDRQNTYGDAEDNFADIAVIASVALAPKLKGPLSAADVALFSAAIKFARLKSSPLHLDNWIDLAGYAVCGGGIVKRQLDTPPVS